MQAGQQLKQQNQIIWFDSEQFQAVDADWFDGQYWQRQGKLTGQSTGRGTTYFFRHKQQEYVLRHYRRGGFIGRLIEDSYWYSGLSHTRAWRELQLLLQLTELGLPVPKPAAARVVRKGPVYQADLILQKIPNAGDVHHLLLDADLDESVWEKIGKTIAHFHRLQIYHHDLNIHNIMLDKQGKVWLIDFDRCALRGGEKWKHQNLARLLRSLHKEAQRHSNYHYQEANWQALQQGYHNS